MRASANKTAGCVCDVWESGAHYLHVSLCRRFCLRCARTRRALITYFADKAASKLGELLFLKMSALMKHYFVFRTFVINLKQGFAQLGGYNLLCFNQPKLQIMEFQPRARLQPVYCLCSKRILLSSYSRELKIFSNSLHIL
jgi:hypothetical protein